VTGGDDVLAEELRALVRAALGREVAAIEPLAGAGLGHRRFLRLRLRGTQAPATLVARVDRGEPAPGVPPEPPLEPMRAFCEAHGLPVPRRFGGGADVDLLEDLGDRSLAGCAAGASPELRRALYATACGLVPRLQRLRDPGGLPAFRRRLDAGLIRLKARRFAAAGLPAVLGRAAREEEVRTVAEAFAAVAEALAGAPLRLAHRDFQGSNLLVREATAGAAGSGPVELVMIDLQGAFLAPPEYDLVCLLRDSYVALDPGELREQAEAVRPRLPDAPEADVFWCRFDLITLVRKAKDHALFHEVAGRGDPRWLRYAPATLDRVREAAVRRAALDPRIGRLAALLGAPGSEAEGHACAR